MVDINQVKKLREKTNISVKDCKKALEETGGDFDKALEKLKEKGIKDVEKKKERETKEGLIGSYLHQNGKIGALVKVYCESDFVAMNEVFKELVHNIAMQIAAMDPESVDDLLSQDYIKDPEKTIEELIKDTVAQLGENIKVESFTRMEI